MLTKNFNDLVGQKYQIIYADPPWKYYGDPNKSQAAGKHYDCMTFEELSELPVRSIFDKKAVMLMWTTSSKMDESIALIKSWGMYYRGVHQVWVKTTNSGKIINGQGARPSFTKPTCEYLLIASTIKAGRIFPIFSENMANVVLEARPNNIHSRKPAIFRENIVTLFGNDLKKVELFARQNFQSWDAWGNEIATNENNELSL